MAREATGDLINRWQHHLFTHTFSAFWLRSSVVSVLTSLISGTGATGPYQDYPYVLNHRGGSRSLLRPPRK